MKTLYSFQNWHPAAALFLAAVFALSGQQASAQSCPASTATPTNITALPNTYYPANQTSLSAGATSISLGTVTNGTTPISSGDILLIIQMQGSEIDSSNTSNYGGTVGTGSGYLNSVLMAGNMEYVVASNNVPVGGGTLNLVHGLTNSYKSSPFGKDGQYTFQVIRVPVYYDAKLTVDLTAPRWDGSSGGVVVIYATRNILLNSHTIDASGLGFRGGGGRSFNGSGSGSSADFLTNSSLNANGSKGEGIAGTPKYLNDNNSFLDVSATEGYPKGSYGKGAPANAGGGGTDGNPASSNDENTGGGGGANGGAGGNGGWAWSSGTPSGGRPGTIFSQASPSRLVMGGGGGSGTTNDGTGNPSNGFASSGSAGGGIIILMAGNVISGTGTLKANGASANSTVKNDGSGGAGAGGSIMLYAANGKTGNITASAIGGTGGSNQTKGGDSHGPGGGGGGGVIYANFALTAASSVAGGGAGSTSGATTNYGATAGSNGMLSATLAPAAVPQFPLQCVVLATSFLTVTATPGNGVINLNWEVAHEVNTREYMVEKSSDGINFSTIGSVAYQVSTTGSNQYSYPDNGNQAAGTVYYRIKEAETSGDLIYSKIVSVHESGQAGSFAVYPNPAKSTVTVSFTASAAATVSLRLFDLKGSLLWQQPYRAATGSNTVQLDCIRTVPDGVYILQWFDGMSSRQVKLMVSH